MRSSIIVASAFTALAVATPVHQALHKKAIVYDIATEIVYVTVTAGEEPTIKKIQKTVYVTPTHAKHAPAPKPTITTTTSTTEKPIVEVVAPTTLVTTSKASTPPAKVVAAPAPSYSSAASSGSSSSSLHGNAKLSVDYHNQCRAKHSAKDVVWDEDLAASAQALADSCSGKHDTTLGGGGYGQNIATKAGSDPNQFSLEDALSSGMESWYNEVSLFQSANLFGTENPPGEVWNGKYDSNGNQIMEDVLHFTQVVWKGTGAIGCGVTYCGDNANLFPGWYSYFTVCNYKAPGNFGGQYVANVAAN